MAIIFPSLDVIHRLKVPPTDGELYLCEFLKDKLDDSFFLFFNPYLDGDRPDIILLKKKHGAVIVEIKDWNLDSYTIDEMNHWSVNGKVDEKKIKSPFAQVFQYKKNLFELHLPTLGLKESLNKNFFKVIDCYVYFHLETKKNIKEKYNLVLDRIQFEIDENNTNFQNKYILYEDYEKKRQYLQRKKHQFDRDEHLSITKDTADHLAKTINKLQPTILFTDDIFDEFFRRLNPPENVHEQGVKLNYDKKQSNLIESVGEFKKVKGVAGCGKTTIIAKRAINAFKRHSSPVLILTFNITLRHYIKDKVSDVRENIGFNNFEIINYHQFFNSQLNNCNIDTNEFKELHLNKNLSEEKVLDLLYKKNFFKGHKVNKYQTILVDEIQDYDSDWVKIIRDNFLDSDGEMILFGDPSQNIYEKDLTKRESVIVQGFGSWEKLTKSYRSNIASPLINLYKEFQKEFLIKKYLDGDIFDSEYKQDAIKFDILKYQTYREHDFKNTYNEIIDYIKVNKFIPNDTTILCSTFEFLRNLNSLFNINEKTMSMCEDNDEHDKIIKFCNDIIRVNNKKERETCYEKRLKNFRRRKKNFFMQNSGLIKLSTIHSFKGLESPTVFCILQENDSPELIYTAMTRAKKNLIIFDVINSHYSSFFKKLLP
jgi:hypothetical protein